MKPIIKNHLSFPLVEQQKVANNHNFSFFLHIFQHYNFRTWFALFTWIQSFFSRKSIYSYLISLSCISTKFFNQKICEKKYIRKKSKDINEINEHYLNLVAVARWNHVEHKTTNKTVGINTPLFLLYLF